MSTEQGVTDPRELLLAAIEASGLSQVQFAGTVILPEQRGVSPRTMRRWIRGDSEIPEPVIQWLSDLVDEGNSPKAA